MRRGQWLKLQCPISRLELTDSIAVTTPYQFVTTLLDPTSTVAQAIQKHLLPLFNGSRKRKRVRECIVRVSDLKRDSLSRADSLA